MIENVGMQLLLILIFSANCFAQQVSLSNLNKLEVFRIESYKNGENRETGSAFVTSVENGIVNLVTARHVVYGSDSIFAISYNNKKYRIFGHREHPSTDIAALSFVGDQARIPLQAINPDLSDKIAFIRLLNNWQIIQGESSSGYIESISKGDISIKNFEVKSGDSGGPVYVGNAIIGMVSFTGAVGYKTMLKIIDIRVIKAAFQDWNIPWQLQEIPIKRPELVLSVSPVSALMNLPVINLTIDGKCPVNANLLVDENLTNAWKCNGYGTTYIYFHLENDVSVKEFKFYQQGSMEKTNEEFPDGRFLVPELQIDYSLKKIMLYKRAYGDGTWVTYQLPKAIVTSVFCLALRSGNQNTAAIYEVKISGFKIQ